MKAMATNQTISWFYQRLKEDTLILSPDFQRNPIWQKPQQDYLIETILLDLPVPEIYIVNRIDTDGSSTWIVVDGQQRLRTILEFVTGELKVDLTDDNVKNIHRFTELSEDDKKKVWRYPIVIRDLEDSSDDNVRNLFQRLNKYSFSLNGQELRNARYRGEFKKTVETLSNHEFWTTSGTFSANDIRRMVDLEFISILLCSLIGGIFHRTDRLDEFYTMYEIEFDQQKYYVDIFSNTLEIVQTILSDIKKTMWRNKANLFTIFLVLSDMDEDKKDIDNLNDMRKLLHKFEDLIKEAKNNDEFDNKNIIDYLDAMSYGTNDKEKRLRRFNILKEYIGS